MNTLAPGALVRRTGRHDDLVLAVAIALWCSTERRKYRTLVSPLRGLYLFREPLHMPGMRHAVFVVVGPADEDRARLRDRRYP